MPEEPLSTLSVEEAAELLHLNVKRVQSLARAGKLPTVRVGRRWLFPRHEIERMIAPRASGSRIDVVPAAAGLELSARNRLRGTIRELRIEGLMAEVVLNVGGQALTSIITRASAERMGLRVGDEAFAVIKSTEVLIGKG